MIKHIFKLIWNKKRSNALMIIEILLSFFVIFFALSYVFFNLEKTNAPLGFETVDKWMVGLDKVEQRDSAERVQIMENLKSNLLAEEEIEGVSFAESMAPFKNSMWTTDFKFNGGVQSTFMVFADTDLMDVMDLNLVAGRWFTEEDLNAPTKPIIINQKLVDDFFEGKIFLDSIMDVSGERKIIGVVDDYKYRGEFFDVYNTCFVLRDYKDNTSWALLDMASGTPASYEEKLSQLVNTTTKTNGNIIQNIEKERIADSRESWILFISLLAICGFLCINVALGLFGVLSYNIIKRKSEIGLRQAIGAHGLDITKQFILEILFLAGIALIIGVFFAIQVPLLDLTEFPDKLFYKAIGYSIITILLLVLSCALFPSFQAAKISPANSLHED